MPKTISVHELKDRIYKIHGKYVILDESTYINTKIKCRFIDVDFGEFFNTPNNVVSKKQGHKLRGIEKRKDTCLKKFGKVSNLLLQENLMRKKFTIEQVREKLLKVDFLFLESEYLGNHIPYDVKCLRCGHERKIPLLRIFDKHRCPGCYGNVKYTIEDVRDFCEKEGLILLSDTYKNLKGKLLIQCPDCFYEFPTTFGRLKDAGSRCPKCAAGKRKETWMANYGVDNPQKCPEIRQKTIETTKERHGVEYPLQSKEIQEKMRETCKEVYGADHPMRNHEIASRCASNRTDKTVLLHWQTGESLTCIASYEVAVVNHLNSRKIPFMWQPRTFAMPDGRTYRPDLYLPLPDKWIEIKGVFRDDAEEKWLWFHSEYANSELWMEKELQEKGIV